MEEKKLRQLRKDILTMLYKCQSGHPGGSLSCVEIISTLYYNVMNIDPYNPQMESRDRFVLSKGHACPALYAVLADLGYFKREDLWTLRQVGSHLQGHPDMTKTPGIDVNTGSLGQGASVAVGLALGAKLKKADYKVYVLIGDGECQEGIVWEAAMSAAHYKLDNLVFILDHNGLQIDGSNNDVMSLGNVVEKFASFGFGAETVDGHDVAALEAAFTKKIEGKPRFINCLTVKGKGVSFMENNFGWHGKAPNADEYASAIQELEV
ncbi:transketolase [Anaerotruncus rubiinfantis]|uniref:transketolase n=1 Tax=Anaerotruncus rubiinfantis TaxID=1720200 RepID=UPI0034A2E585